MVAKKITYEKLTDSEVEKLRVKLREKQGNLNKCKEATNLNANTLKRAAAGLDVLGKNAKIIREKLLSNQLQAA